MGKIWWIISTGKVSGSIRRISMEEETWPTPIIMVNSDSQRASYKTWGDHEREYPNWIKSSSRLVMMQMF
jgi:hypothetical protein